MDKNYDFLKVEPKIVEFWIQNNCFKKSGDTTKPPFTIILPPPNANAVLHFGHSLYCAEDLMIRYKKLRGFNSYWVPGLDHAGFETQVVFEKKLSKEGKSRFDFSRDDLYQQIYQFVEDNKSLIKKQLTRLGFSLDWENSHYTLGDDSIKIVYQTFKKMFEEGLVYRGDRLINYCCKHETGLSDLEVSYLEKQDKLYYVKYQVDESSHELVVATVRPETIFADVALCVHPEDPRYDELIGKKAINPLTNQRIPIISDEAVLPDFGTGVLKITPLHDFNDYEISKRHSLLEISVSCLNQKGRMTEVAGEFEGLKIAEAREKVASKLSEDGRLDKIETYTHQVPCCYKCENTLEPLMIPQWFIKTDSLAKGAIKVVKEGKIKFYPSRFEEVYLNWLEKITDWNISRQIVWGMKIPAFECQNCHKWVITLGEKPLNACECGSLEFKQDTDTFDTWFSSGQWPLITLGYPNSQDFKYRYPTDVLETAYDIIFFWVARMVMLGVYLTGEVPFKNVYLHGLVRDSKGQKMSKSKGNVIDPLEAVEKFGADSVRMALLMSAPAGNDQNYNESKLVGCRNFGNKVWNMARFIEMTAPQDFNFSSSSDWGKLKEIDSSMVSRHLEFVKNVTINMEHFKFSIAGEEIYDYMWNTLASEVLEKTKEDSKYLVLLNAFFKDCLITLHPFMPFITEEIWQSLYAREKSTSISDTTWPGLEI